MPAKKRDLEATTTPAAKTARGRGRGNGRCQHAAGRGANASGSSAQASTAVVLQGSAQTDGCINAALYKQVAEARAIRTSNMALSDILTASPIGVASGGFKAAYDGEQCMMSLSLHNKYESANNFFVLDPFNHVLDELPVNPKQINYLRDQFFKTPPPIFPYSLAGTLHSDQDPAAHAGTIPVLSPLETVWAPVLAAADAVSAAASEDVLQQWRKCLLTVTVRFEVLDNKSDRVWRAHNLRESQVGIAHAVKMSALQCVMAVTHSKLALEAQLGCELGAQAHAEAWSKNVTLAPSSEVMKTGLVDACYTTHNRALRHDEIRDLLWDADRELDATPFDSVYKIEAAVKRGQSTEGILWCIGGVLDAVRFQGVTPGEVALRVLTGRGLPGGKGLFDLIVVAGIPLNRDNP